MIKFISKLLTSPAIHFPFSTTKLYEYQINSQLLLNYKQYQPWKSIQLMHSITMIKYQQEMEEIVNGAKWREDELKIQEIISFISSELHLVPHREINYLLEILKQRGFRYERNVSIFKALNKQGKLFFGNKYQGQQLLKSLILMKSLNFPKNTWTKLIESFLSINPDDYKQNKRLSLTINDLFKIAILILQQPFVPLFLVKKMIERLTKQNAKTLQSLSSLYHINQILEPSLQRQVQYQFTKSNIKDILFNSYNIQPQPNKEQIIQSDNGNNQQVQKSQEQNSEMKKKLMEYRDEILKMFQGSIDANRLQKEILKLIEHDQQSISKSIILFTSDIKALRPYLYEYLNQHLNQLTPVQFVHLIRKCESESAKGYLSNYMNVLGQHMNVQEKAYLYSEIYRAFQISVEPQIIVDLIKPLQEITYNEFLAITRLVQLIPSNSKGKITQILALIQSKVPKQ